VRELVLVEKVIELGACQRVGGGDQQHNSGELDGPAKRLPASESRLRASESRLRASESSLENVSSASEVSADLLQSCVQAVGPLLSSFLGRGLLDLRVSSGWYSLFAPAEIPASWLLVIKARAHLSQPIEPGCSVLKIRTVKVFACSDCPAHQQLLGMLIGGVCQCMLCDANKKDYQDEARRGQPRTKDFQLELFEKRKEIDSETLTTAQSAELKSVGREPIHIHDATAPPVLHIFLGLGNDLIEIARRTARAIDRNHDGRREVSKADKKNLKTAASAARAAKTDVERTQAALASVIDNFEGAASRAEKIRLLQLRGTRNGEFSVAIASYRQAQDEAKGAALACTKAVADHAAAQRAVDGAKDATWTMGEVETEVVRIVEKDLGGIGQGFHGKLLPALPA